LVWNGPPGVNQLSNWRFINAGRALLELACIFINFLTFARICLHLLEFAWVYICLTLLTFACFCLHLRAFA
jgi:hypothetical protein